MGSEFDLGTIRRVFAKNVMAAAGVEDTRIENAFAAVEREHFLGPGPWPIARAQGYLLTPSADPLYIYTNDVVGISSERGINNGAPSFHARQFFHINVNEGEHIVHIGSGVGYYTAILAMLVGDSGAVIAIEYEPDLAEKCRDNLKSFSNVDVIQGDGSTIPFGSTDIIYVNAGVTKPSLNWLYRLREGGRLVLPLTTDSGSRVDSAVQLSRRGAVFLITRRSDAYSAQWTSPVAIYPCQGMRDPISEIALKAAFESGNVKKVTRLFLGADVSSDRCWLKATDWALAYS